MGKTVRGGTVISGLPIGGTVAPGDLVGWSANKLVRANADAGVNVPAVAVAAAAYKANDTGAVVVGAVEVDGFAALTVGASVHLAEGGAGGVQEAAPVGAGKWKQVVGFAAAADRVIFTFPEVGAQL